ncbi:WD40-repeat-containing domain protein [Parasitella parasitica]|nr:WD40-repeat-containing domain protein [Parasitella parasitica]
MALVYGHNDVEIFNVASQEVVYHVQCDVKCILYSARIFGSTPESLIVASGTVFNEVHLWKPFEKQGQGDAPVYRKLTGHEGVIFGIQFNEDASQIVSVSDDRTIRVWPLKEEDNVEPLVFFGHTARVWDCQFVDEYLVSISEDSTCRVWRNTLITPAKEEDTGDCVACWEGHASKNVWSCAINPEHKIVATGGQDSGIRLWSLLSIKANKIDSEDDLVALPLPEERGTDNIRNFVMIKNRWIVAATLEGYLLKCDGTVTPHQWTEIQHDSSYKNYAIMKSSECGRVVIVGNIFGDLVVISPTDIFQPLKISAHKQKLFTIFIEQSSDENILHVISNGFNDSVLFHRLDLSTSTPTIRTLFNLEMPPERTTLLSLAFSEEKNILLCGSRESALLIYRVPFYTMVSEDTVQSLKPTLQLRRSHSKQAITSVLIKNPAQDRDDTQDDEDEMIDKDTSEQGNQLEFWTAGRDGCFVQYRLNILNDRTRPDQTQLGVANRGDTVFTSNDLVLEKLYRNKITKGTLEGSMLINGQLLLMGFFRKNFFVFNEKKNFMAVAINCGGGHRRWGFSTQDAKLNKSAFAFIRKEVLYAYFRDTSSVTDNFSESILQGNYHGREVRALRFLPLVSSNAILFATGGEDTLLRIQQYAPEAPSKFHTHVSIRKHTTVIKNIDYSQGLSTLLFTSGGLEEFRCWKIEASPPKIAGGLVDLNCLEVATCPTMSVDIESRIMDTTACAVDIKKGLHIIGAVYSDAVIRFWLFNEATRKFCLVADGTWHAKCILQIIHVKLADKMYFLTSATDGRVAVWDMDHDLREAVKNHQQLEVEPTKAAFRLSEPLYHYSVHMSGVNALEAVQYRDEQHMIVFTGGEDDAVSAALLKVDDHSVTPVGKPFILPYAHASSVTGIKFIDQSLFTTSTDQRLNKWEVIDLKEQGVSLSMSDAVYLDVPDPSALDAVVFNGQVHAAITGVGLQSVKYNLPCHNKLE